MVSDNCYCFPCSFSARGGDLFARIDGDSLPEFEAVKILKQVLDALKFMHDHGFMHLDLKVRTCARRNRRMSLPRLFDSLSVFTMYAVSLERENMFLLDKRQPVHIKAEVLSQIIRSFAGLYPNEGIGRQRQSLSCRPSHFISRQLSLVSFSYLASDYKIP